MNPLSKVLIGVMGLGVTATGVYFSIPSTSTSTGKIRTSSIRERLEKSGYKLLDLNPQDKVTNASQWGEIKTAYDKEKDASFRFSGVESISENIVSEIKESCSSLLSSQSDSASDLEKARRWCVVPVTVASRVIETLTLLPVDGSSDSDVWDMKFRNYQDSNFKTPKVPITKASGSVILSDLKNRCKELRDSHTFDRDFETLVSYVTDWCSKPKVV